MAPTAEIGNDNKAEEAPVHDNAMDKEEDEIMAPTRRAGMEIMGLGPEFASARAVMVSEAALIMRKMKRDSTTDLESNVMFKQSFDYVNTFDKFKDEETAKLVADKLSEHLGYLHEFELVQLANLLPDNAEEARALIPSLKGRIDDDMLYKLLQELLNYAS